MPIRRVWTLILLLAGLAAGGCQPDEQAQPAATTEDKRPNILLLVADDLGYSDLGSYGGEISTPHLDELARSGVRFADFSVAVTCSTTRSMLLSGVDNHRNGLGGLDATGRPRKGADRGYEGYLNDDVVSIATVLRDAGYHTYMAGKWHLGNDLETGPEGRGFEAAFVTPGGAADHFSQRNLFGGSPQTQYREGGKPTTLPDDFYSSAFFTDKLIEYIDANADDGRPFFAYAAYTAPHWPLQAPDEFIERYAGVYEDGYDDIRRARLARLVEQGFFADTPTAMPDNHVRRDWAELDEAQQRREARLMQVYAAMVEALDAHIGRLFEYLDENGELDNTFVIFISDNGPEGNDPVVIPRNPNHVAENFLTDTDSLGGPGSFSSYGPGWAAVSAAPFHLYKTFPTEGGLRVPAIFRLPGQQTGQARPVQAFATVLDIAPTLLDLAGVAHPAGAGEATVLPLQGRSMLPLLMGDAEYVHAADDAVGWELYGRRALRSGNWKLLRIDPPYGSGEWQLYDMSADPFEQRDLAASEPDALATMLQRWNTYASDNNVVEFNYDDQQYGNVNKHYER